jgi:hypothetical protein
MVTKMGRNWRCRQLKKLLFVSVLNFPYSSPASLMPSSTQRNIALLVLAVLAFAGCKKGSFSVNFNAHPGASSSDWTVNGQRTITRTHDGVTRKLKAAAEIEIQSGHVTKFPKGALIKLEESGGSAPRQAELRENGGSLELWIKDQATFRQGSSEEETWLAHFLTDVTTP